MPSIRARLVLPALVAIVVVFSLMWIVGELSAGDSTAHVSIRSTLLFGFLLSLVTLAGLAEWGTRRFAGPIAELRRTADALAAGDFSARVRARRRDEIGALGRAIDRMAEQLKERLSEATGEEMRLRVMLDAMEEAVLVTDNESQIVLTNKAFVRLTGSSGNGRTIVEAVRSGELHDAVRVAIGGKRTKITFDLEASREIRTLSAHVAPLPRQAGIIVVLHDITELRRLDAVRRDFVANASHELRTPLTAIRGFAETLRDGALDEPRIAKRFVGNIVDNAMRLSRLVDDLLELSRSESPEAILELEPIDSLAAAGKVLSSLEGKASDKGVQLALEGVSNAPWIRGDAQALDQVLINLVDNGIKYTPSGGRVVVRFRTEPEHLSIEVADTGPGIAASHLPRIFERFYRVDAGRSREQGGTGLGLAIVKHLTQRMGGEVSVQSKAGKGTTFRVRLERADRQREDSLIPPSIPPESEPALARHRATS